MEPAAANRLRVFSADMTISVASVDDSREALLSLTDELGGYVESSQRDYMVIRVPAATFDQAIARVASLGIVIDRSIRAADVTEQYADISNRLRIAVAARERLEELLAGSDDSEEQVKILREIRRLAEEIEQLRGEIATLDQLIAFSRVAVTLVLAGKPIGSLAKRYRLVGFGALTLSPRRPRPLVHAFRSKSKTTSPNSPPGNSFGPRAPTVCAFESVRLETLREGAESFGSGRSYFTSGCSIVRSRQPLPASSSA